MAIEKYHIGTTQWGLREWRGVLYSKKATPDQFLRQYATVFNTVEGNTTFYRVPDAETVIKWGESVPGGFRFCFKFPRGITHYSRLVGVERDVISFLNRFEPIRTKLGPFHIQLDEAFSYEEVGHLEELLAFLPREYAYAVEVRHPDFYDRGKKERHLTHLLKSYHIDRVIFDTRRLHALSGKDPSIFEAQKKKPKLPVRFDATGSRPFVRYVGANNWLNNEAYLKEWAIVVADWIRDGLHPYVFIHAPQTLHAPELARHFHRQLSGLIGLNSMPVWPAEKQSEQLGLF
jgi:uncharacterized protein YecE (DUF72 family)